MNTKDTHCSACNKDFITRKDLTDHNACMRKQGKVVGHEKAQQSLAGSKAGSQIGSKDTKMKDVDNFISRDLTLENFLKEPLPTDGFGMPPLEKEQLIAEPTFKAPINKTKI